METKCELTIGKSYLFESLDGSIVEADLIHVLADGQVVLQTGTVYLKMPIASILCEEPADDDEDDDDGDQDDIDWGDPGAGPNDQSSIPVGLMFLSCLLMVITIGTQVYTMWMLRENAKTLEAHSERIEAIRESYSRRREPSAPWGTFSYGSEQ